MAEVTTTSFMSAPKTRVGVDWVFNARLCAVGDAEIVSVFLSAPGASSSTAQARSNVTGVWGPWVDLDLVANQWIFNLVGVVVDTNQCANIQIRGTSVTAGTYTMTAAWTTAAGVTYPTEATLQTVEAAPTVVTSGASRIEGVSCLGTGEYAARIVSRATRDSPPHIIGEELLPYSGNWARLINGTSEASLRISLRNADGSQNDCCDTVRQIQTWRHELEIYRSGEQVWAGPVMSVKAEPAQGEVEIAAKDLSAWWGRRFLLQDFISRQEDLAAIFEKYVKYTTSIDDYGLDVETTPCGILGDRTVEAAAVLSASNELNELDRTGVDWTVCNRLAFVGGITINGKNLTIPTVLTDESFSTPPTTSLSGLEQGNDWYVKGRVDVGRYGGADADGVLLQAKRTEYSIEDQGSADGAARTSWQRTHDPLPYLEGDNALDARAEVGIQELVPGVQVQINLSGGGCVPLATTLRLERIAVNFQPKGEEVSVYLQPIGAVSVDES